MIRASRLGRFAQGLTTDLLGYIPEAHDGPWDLQPDHHKQATHYHDGTLTDYGRWWEDEGFPAWRQTCVAVVAEASVSLDGLR